MNLYPGAHAEPNEEVVRIEEQAIVPVAPNEVENILVNPEVESEAVAEAANPRGLDVGMVG